MAIWEFTIRKPRKIVLADLHTSTFGVLWAQDCVLHTWGSPTACVPRGVNADRATGEPTVPTPSLPASFRAHRPREASRDIQPQGL